MIIKDILKGVKHKADKAALSFPVKDLTCDSRAVRKGSTFIACRGFAQDGYQYIGQAVAKGAGAVISEKDIDLPQQVHKVLVDDTRTAFPIIAANYFRHPSDKLKMAGITGTNGKTTITYIIENILKKAGKRPGVIGTINYRYGLKCIPAKNTTPGPLELQGLLSCMLKNGVGYVAMEVSSHSLDQGRVSGISFDHAIFTNFTQDHLDYHKTMRRYFESKVKLFDKLKKGGTAILNHDDKKVRALAKKLKCKVLTYGMSKGSDIRAVDAEITLEGSRFNIVTPKGKLHIDTGLIGRHNISNILAAAAFAYSAGLGMKAIIDGIGSARPAPGRLEPVRAGQRFKVFVDFAHTQDALCNVLGLLKDAASMSRIITVFGCGGNRDKTKRPLMGRAACELSDEVVITSDNPRREEPEAIIDDILAGVKGSFDNYEVVVDRALAIERAFRKAGPEDIVVIAGKGHEKYQIVGDSVYPFDDCKVALSILKEKI